MNQKFTIAGDSRSFTTIRRSATGNAIAKGEPVLFPSTNAYPEFCFTLDAYDGTTEEVLVWQTERARVHAVQANQQIAAVHFKATDYLYWDDTAKKVTNVSTNNTLFGRALEEQDFSAGVPEGASLLFMTQLQI